jgi:hypothetical protein
MSRGFLPDLDAAPTHADVCANGGVIRSWQVHRAVWCPRDGDADGGEQGGDGGIEERDVSPSTKAEWPSVWTVPPP